MKNKDIVADVTNDLRALNIDDRISKRYILSKARDYAGLFLKRENDQFRLFSHTNMWYTIDCLQTVEADKAECKQVSVDKGIILRKSKEPLPELYSYRNGPLIREVVSVDGSTIFHPTTPTQYRSIMNREFIDRSRRYYWYQNNHIYITSSAELISVTGCFKDRSIAKSINNCEEDYCQDPLEENFDCPAHLLGIVKQETVKDLFSFYKRNVLDTDPDGDNNDKNAS